MRNIFNLFGRKGKLTIPVQGQLMDDINSGKLPFNFSCIFTCACGANLKLRKREDRDYGPSNYKGVHTTLTVQQFGLPQDRIGHSIVPHGQLNWKGIAEENGWDTDPIKCPACKAGLSLEDYKEKVRTGQILKTSK